MDGSISELEYGRRKGGIRIDARQYHRHLERELHPSASSYVPGAIPRPMSNLDLCFIPATELIDAIRAKKVSAVEVTTAVLARIAALEPKLNAFPYLAAAEAMDAARTAD